MLILVNGLPYFSKRLVNDLNEFDPANNYRFLNTYDSLIDKVKFMFLLPFSGAVVSSNGVSDYSGSMEKVVKWKKKLVMQWHGTDVVLAKKRFADGTINQKYIACAKHLFAAPWFAKELNDIRILGEYAPISYIDKAGNSGTYKELSILTYLAKGRESFYGWDLIRELAISRPNLKIIVVGSEGRGLDCPSNVTFLGWVNESDMQELLKINPIFLRMTEHDGNSVSVSQALGAGAEVIWTYSAPRCHTIDRNSKALQSKINQLELILKEREYKPNEENIEYALQHLNRNAVMLNFVEKLNIALNE